MIDLVTGKTCDSLDDYPVGTLGLYPLVCDGYVSERPNTNQCKILGFSGEYVSKYQVGRGILKWVLKSKIFGQKSI